MTLVLSTICKVSPHNKSKSQDSYELFSFVAPVKMLSKSFKDNGKFSLRAGQRKMILLEEP